MPFGPCILMVSMNRLYPGSFIGGVVTLHRIQTASDKRALNAGRRVKTLYRNELTLHALWPLYPNCFYAESLLYGTHRGSLWRASSL